MAIGRLEREQDLERFVRDLLDAELTRLRALTNSFYEGDGSPEGAVAAPIGSLYRNRSGAAGTTLYVKEAGTGNTGWIGK